MCGPGTGIAPFRAFLQERAACGIKGRAWLLFGERQRAHDFLYEAELKAWLADGTLSRLDVAFSRDQAKKDYVQHRMAENAADLWRWLQDGAHFYVCGDATRMARDVDAALRRIAMTEGKLDEARRATGSSRWRAKAATSATSTDAALSRPSSISLAGPRWSSVPARLHSARQSCWPRPAPMCARRPISTTRC